MHARLLSRLVSLLALLVVVLAIGASCTTLKEGYRAACIEACRKGGAAQGTSRCERGCRSR